jgi:hypothetical protein
MSAMTTAAPMPMAPRRAELKLWRWATLLCVALVIAGTAVALLTRSAGPGPASATATLPQFDGAFGADHAASSLAAWRQLPLAAQVAVSRAIGQDESRFHAVRTAAGLRLANTVRGTFTPGGARLSADGADIHLALSAVGYGAALHTLSHVAPHADGNRVLYVHPGLTEWYANGPAGLQQGVTLDARPADAGHGNLTLGLTTDAAPATDGKSATFTKGAASLTYSGLSATDARGRALPARLHTAHGQLRISVDDRHAVYPITVDPFFQSARLNKTGGQEGDAFGSSVAISGDTIVVGQPTWRDYGYTQPGAAYVFERPAGGWADATQTAKLTPSDGAASTGFGGAVALDDEAIVVGAPRSGTYQGSVYVFSRPAGGWTDATETTRLTASDAGDYNYFGYAVALRDDTLVVAAPFGLIGNIQGAGKVYVYTRGASGWGSVTETAQLSPSHRANGDAFGTAMALSDDTLVIGAPNIYQEANGAVDVFTRPPGGWTSATETATLTASDGATGDYLGGGVAVDGDTIVAGAADDDIGANTDQGSAYVFVRPGGGWVNATQTAKLTASDGAAHDSLGAAVAFAGDRIAVGAPFAEVDGLQYTGAAYVFDKPTTGWADATETAKLTPRDVQGDSTGWYGYALAMAGTTIVSGAPWSNPDASGNAYVYELDTTPPDTTITSGPAGTITVDHATFGFTSEAGAMFECRVDNDPFAACTSPYTTGHLTNAQHTFEVRATDAAGNTDATPASRTFTVAVDTTPPETTITSGPSGQFTPGLLDLRGQPGPLTNDSTPTFGFTSSEAGSTFACQTDGGAFHPCTSPFTTAHLADGQHSFAVRATDTAGNTDPTPASKVFTVSPQCTLIGITITLLGPPIKICLIEARSAAAGASAGKPTVASTTARLVRGGHTFATGTGRGTSRVKLRLTKRLRAGFYTVKLSARTTGVRTLTGRGSIHVTTKLARRLNRTR